MSTDSLFIASAGDAALPAAVLVHGSMDRSAGMLRLSRRLDHEFHVTRYDRRGYGRSVGAPGPFTVSSHVADLEMVCRELDGPVRLFGHSFGGNVALALAERRPDLVHSVVVYETPLSWVDWWPGNTAGAIAALVQDPADSAEAFMRRLVGDDVWEHLPPSTRQARRDEGPAMVDELTDLRSAPPWNGCGVTCPVVAVHGENGREHHRRGAAVLADMVSNSTLVELPDAGHGAPNSHAADLAALLAAAWN